MNMTKLCEQLYEASIQAGVVAKAMQKDISNEGKVVKQEEGEEAYHYQMRCAKTKVDVMVQDILLCAMRGYDMMLTLDVEEESERCASFPCLDHQTTLVIDPIDGTLDYIHQLDTYSICSAIIENGCICCAVVYFPKRNIAYTYDPMYQARVFPQADTRQFTQGEPLIGIDTAKQLVYRHDRVKQDVVELFERAGYEVRDDRTCTCPQALLACLTGDALCYVSDTRNIRDILIGAILSNMQQGAVLDLQGKAIDWPAGGRLPFGIFTMYPQKVKAILKSKEV